MLGEGDGGTSELNTVGITVCCEDQIKEERGLQKNSGKRKALPFNATVSSCNNPGRWLSQIPWCSISESDKAAEQCLPRKRQGVK